MQKTLNVCSFCRDEFRSQRVQRCCSRSCHISLRNKTFNIKDAWKKKYGDAWEERYNQWLMKMSTVTSGDKNGMYGRCHTEEAGERIAVRTRGKSLEVIYGVEQAQDMKRRMSLAQRGEKNPAYGKVYLNGGKSVKGHYKGLFFRSLLEYSFMKHLENDGLSLSDDVDYECFIVPYTLEGRTRTYRIDFYVKSRSTVYEIKPSYVMKRVSSINEVKWNAAREFFTQRGLEFRVMTDFDFPKIAFGVAKQDVDVVWKEETFKYFKRTE